MITKKYQLSGLHCTSCSLLIEGELEDIGVEGRVKYASQELEATFDPKVVDENDVVQAIKKLGYSIHAPHE